MTADITLTDAITAVVSEKRAVGYTYDAEQQVLARFEAFCRRGLPGQDTLTEASVQAWIATAARRGVTPATPRGLAAPVRELARWLSRRGVAAYLLPTAALPRPARYVPHIYTDRELAALFTHTDRCHYCCQVRLRHLVMPVLFRTIYACGPRCSQARLLHVEDVDLDAGIPHIRDAKGGTDRQLPVSEPLRARLAGYHTQLAGQPGRWEWFFPGSAARPLPLGNVGHNFRRFLCPRPHLPRRARARPQGGRSAPHVRGQQPAALVRSGTRRRRAAGGAANLHGPFVSVSTQLTDTAYYLHLTAESYPDITARVRQVIGDIVPPVTAGPRHGH
jgi:integrase/recombinase XerD